MKVDAQAKNFLTNVSITLLDTYETSQTLIKLETFELCC